GVACVVDLAAMRDAIVALGGNPDRVNPLQHVELVIDHSVQVYYLARPGAFSLNAELELSRNEVRYAFRRLGQRADINLLVVLTVTQQLLKHSLVGKFVEYYGDGLRHLTIADRATLGNMCPEYGATIAIFPIDEMTLDYLRLTGRDRSRIELVDAYARAQGLFRNPGDADPVYSETIELDLSTVEPSLAGPRRPQDRVALHNAKSGFRTA